MRTGIIIFPGSNCDHDCDMAVRRLLGVVPLLIWHKEQSLPPLDLLILPGGFSYGDYLRAGAIARFSPIMPAVARFAAEGGFLLGICNGFQILTEAGLLPGALMRNRSLKFVCRDIFVRVESRATAFSRLSREGEVLRLPIAHAEGNYYIDPAGADLLRRRGEVIFRYCLPDGTTSPEANPNGSLDNIAGIANEQGNVLGMMPHPERAADPALGKSDGERLFLSIAEQIAVGAS